MRVWFLLKILGTAPIIAGIIYAWRDGNYGLALFMWGIYVLVSYLVWFVQSGKFKATKDKYT